MKLLELYEIGGTEFLLINPMKVISVFNRGKVTHVEVEGGKVYQVKDSVYQVTSAWEKAVNTRNNYE